MGVWNSFGKKTLSSILNIKNPQSLWDIQGQVFTELLTAWSRPPRSLEKSFVKYQAIDDEGSMGIHEITQRE